MVATTTEQLTALAGTTVIVHPLVLLSVTDHHARSVSRSSQKRVIGVLLGQDNGKTINVANSFGIPFEEDEKDSKTWFLDHNYIEGMYEMFKKVNARERMIGWYHTGPKLRASDQEINDLFKRFIARPVMVIVDVRPQVVGMPTDAYFAVEEIKDDGTETRKTFLHVPSAIEAEEAEEIGVEHLLRDIKDSTTTTLATRVSEQLASLRGLQFRLSDIQKYLVDVAAGKMPVNHQIVYHLQDALNLLPDLTDSVLTQSFASSTNDQMLVVYLSSLLRAVIALHALVDNKATIGRAELEQGEKKDEEGEKDKDKKDTASASSGKTDVGHQAASCPKAGTPTCYNCGAEGHVSRDCSAPAKAKSCYKCGQEGHISRDCTEAGNSTGGGGGYGGGGGSGTECYKCGKVGHIARACPEATSGGGGGGSYSSFGGGGGGSQKTCYTCGGVGHLSRDCVQGSKCYNCSGVGHISRDCPQPQKRACYTCGSEGHISRDCPGVGDGAA